ncbi:MAG: DUF2508 family protein [Christensenellales bacterium]|jgi:hypothetical protein
MLEEKTKGKALSQNSNEYLKKALAAWKDAQNYFDNVADPDLIEFAVYDMQAAQRRYEYMLKCVKRGEIDPWAATPALSQEQRNAKEHTKRIDKQLIWKMMHQGREDNRQEPSAQDIKQTPQT